MAKGEKTRLGRALVKEKQHNQMVQQSNEKETYHRSQHKKVLESYTEISDIEAVIEQVDEAHRLFSDLNPAGKHTFKLDNGSGRNEITANERKELHKREEALHASTLRIPRRPAWNAQMRVEELNANERRAFLVWRRKLASLEENENLVLTPFEKNLDIWRQLWRVLEHSDLIVMVVDARDPLFYRCPDLETYAREIDEHKRTLLLVNKADLLPYKVREKWAKYFHQNEILYLFWSAKAATAVIEGKNFVVSTEETANNAEDTKIYTREELLFRLQSEAEDIVLMRNKSNPEKSCAGHVASHGVVVGFVGYPNVGKSSTINALVGEKKTGVTSTPGKTKHFKTLIISDKLTLCVCPGLVFPSLTSSRYEMIASGVLPIDRMTEQREAIQVVANQVPRAVIEDVYKISLPKPKAHEARNRAPLAHEVLRAYCASRGYVASGGLPDETRAARQILKDYIDGKLAHFEMPPEKSNSEFDSIDDGDAEVGSDSGGEGKVTGLGLENALSDLNGFGMDDGLAPDSKVVGVVKEKPGRAPHKMHKKTQRKKDNSVLENGLNQNIAIAFEDVKDATFQSVSNSTSPSAASLRVPNAAQFLHSTRGEWTAICIQTAFRGFLARRALRALKGLVRFQALVRGHVVRKQAAFIFRCMQALMRVQARVRTRRVRMALESQTEQQQLQQQLEHEAHVKEIKDGWCDNVGSVEDIQTKLMKRKEAAAKRERAMTYALANQAMLRPRSNPKERSSLVNKSRSKQLSPPGKENVHPNTKDQNSKKLTMSKGEKTGLGHAVVKQHKQMVQQSKEKGTYSVLEKPAQEGSGIVYGEKRHRSCYQAG